MLALVVSAAAVATAWEPDRSVSSLTARWAPPPSRFVEVEGLAVHVRDVGPRDDEAPLVLLHGTSASLHTWEGWVERLSPTRRVVTLDLPGFGLTGTARDDDVTVARTLVILEALLAKLGLKQVVLGGNSYGGHLAWAYAVKHPEQVTRLILVDAAGYPRAERSLPLGFRLAATPGLRRLMEVLLPRGVVEQSVRNVYGDPSKVTPELVDRYFELTLREGNRRAVGLRFAQLASPVDTAPLKTLAVPTLILWGAKDELIPLESGRRFDADLPDSELVVFDALGHVPHEEDAAATAAVVLRWLAAGATERGL